jgi:hypothetical protein
MLPPHARWRSQNHLNHLKLRQERPRSLSACRANRLLLLWCHVSGPMLQAATTVGPSFDVTSSNTRLDLDMWLRLLNNTENCEHQEVGLALSPVKVRS